jgi:hypothetical protein
MVVTMSLHLYFKVAGCDKEWGLYPPSGWCQRTQGVGDYFRLVPANQEVSASIQLVLENSGSCSFLQIGVCKLGGWFLLPVGVGGCILDIYNKVILWFSSIWVSTKIWCTVDVVI